MFTATQRAVVRVLSDGRPHAVAELAGCMPRAGRLSSIFPVLTKIRRAIRPEQGDVVTARDRRFRLVGPSGDYWLEKDFILRVFRRDGGLCRVCGAAARMVFRKRKDPHLRFVLSNATTSCTNCRLLGRCLRPHPTP